MKSDIDIAKKLFWGYPTVSWWCLKKAGVEDPLQTIHDLIAIGYRIDLLYVERQEEASLDISPRFSMCWEVAQAVEAVE
ncbi:hypothetical protein [Neptunomonas phycophila]|uniref:hypothetical protein n=1 Tax=Neptunomonas phycophila TaxID=1572645 RepID=UPI000948A801|nr:hypothetical protein [Neptunomonas phycophila]MDO6467384.1 hypothetical protein [Neptunomonas phycophila]